MDLLPNGLPMGNQQNRTRAWGWRPVPAPWKRLSNIRICWPWARVKVDRTWVAHPPLGREVNMKAVFPCPLWHKRTSLRGTGSWFLSFTDSGIHSINDISETQVWTRRSQIMVIIITKWQLVVWSSSEAIMKRIHFSNQNKTHFVSSRGDMDTCMNNGLDGVDDNRVATHGTSKRRFSEAQLSFST